MMIKKIIFLWPKKENNTEFFLQKKKETSFDTLHQIYRSVEELFAQRPKVGKSVSKCASLLSQIANCFTDSNLAHIDPILSEFLASNRHMLSLIIQHLVHSHQHPEMDRLNKKTKIYINKLDQFLYVDETSFAQMLTNTFHSFSTGALLVTSDNLALQINHLVDLLEKLLFSLNEKLSLKYSLDYSADLTTLDECLVSHIAQFKQSLCSLNSSSGLVESIVQLRGLFGTEQNQKVDAVQVQELKKKLLQKEECIGELETRCKEWQSKCDQCQADIAQLRSTLQTEKSWQQNDNLDELDKHLERPTVQLYQSHLESVNKQMQLLDSKAGYYYDEMASLIERLRLQISINDAQSHELAEIKDQLERTRSSYEMQISTMSDHLIEVTERMTKQDEENEKLKHELDMVYASKSTKAKRTK
ncbi:phosphatase 1 regulatory subunit [Brachionus plicatilis]|uniref:Phosphatase 1 regulatory subunit n=1 Tax=Brachionus plicatilis TaxID=10195 RepID=A0A3M7RTS7_BRAPC|nr:phosphatase 1 regulatory subunit [Brachionus plicatilis]